MLAAIHGPYDIGATSTRCAQKQYMRVFDKLINAKSGVQNLDKELMAGPKKR